MMKSLKQLFLSQLQVTLAHVRVLTIELETVVNAAGGVRTQSQGAIVLFVTPNMSVEK